MLAVWTAGAAHAQRGGARDGDGAGARERASFAQMLEQMDTDGDGRIARAEFRGPPAAFARLDTDGDGFITAAEGEEGPGRQGQGQGQRVEDGAALRLIDGHLHLSVGRDAAADHAGAARAAIQMMDEQGIAVGVLMWQPAPAGHYPAHYERDLLKVARDHPGRFAVLGGGATLNGMINSAHRNGTLTEAERKAFADTAERLLADGVVGFGELTALHYSFSSSHPFEAVPPDHPLFLLLADIAAKHGVPIDLHVEAVPDDMPTQPEVLKRSNSNPRISKGNLAAFERLLAHNRGAAIVWAHAGWDNTGHRTPALMRQLMNRHPNLYHSLKLFPAVVSGGSAAPDGRLTAEWVRLIADFPDRFIMGTDNQTQAAGASRRRPQGAERTVRAIRALPPALARKVGYENAARLFKIAPIDQPR